MCTIRLATGQQLMDIRLMAYIENQAVIHRIKNSFNGDRKLYGTQITGEMPAGSGDAVNEKFTDLIAEL